MSLQPEWYKKSTKTLEPEWDKRLELLGADKIRALILENKSLTLKIPQPIFVVNPETGTSVEANPSIEYAITWLSRKVENEQKQRENERNITVKMQRIALFISALSAIAALANVIRLFTQ
jgi:hypothetical protein